MQIATDLFIVYIVQLGTFLKQISIVYAIISIGIIAIIGYKILSKLNELLGNVYDIKEMLNGLFEDPDDVQKAGFCRGGEK